MRNWILGGLITAMAYGLGGPALALSGADDIMNYTSLGECVVYEYSNQDYDLPGSAEVSLHPPSLFAGGTVFLGSPSGSFVESRPSITKQAIAQCLAIDEAEITYLVQDGADGTFEEDDVIGFGFVLSNAAFGFTANTFHTFQVGSGTLTPPNLSAPTLSSSSPSFGATDVPVDSNVVLTFSEPVFAKTGSISVVKVFEFKGVQIIESFDVAASNAVTGSGTTTITIDPTSDLEASTEYYVEMDDTVFDDAEGNSFSGISGPTAVSFTTAAPPNTAPTADAGPDQTGIASAASVTLDGTGSSDPDTGDTLSYAWTQTDSSGQTVTLSDATAAQPSFTAPTLDINDAAVTLTFSLVVTDDKSNASTADTVDITVNPPAPTPASEFEKYREDSKRVLVDEATRSLSSTLSANQGMTRQARNRFLDSRFQVDGEASGLVSRNNVPFDVDGSFELSGTTLSTRGNFFEQTGNYDGTSRRLFFGDFDIQHDAYTDSTTATLTARVAWEHLVSEQTMLGYFVGGELARSTINGTFDGDQDRFGMTIGGYAVHQLDDQVYLDGFLTLGLGNNDLEMANDVLALESDYTTRTATIGAALSGRYEHKQFEFRPELAFSYGKTWIGNVSFTGRAYGLVDDTLSLDAGSVSIANLTLRPEVVWALDADTVADSTSKFSFAPRLICESRETMRRTEDCGGGAELGLSRQSDNGLSTAEFRVIMDRVGDTTRSSFAFNLEHQF